MFGLPLTRVETGVRRLERALAALRRGLAVTGLDALLREPAV